MHHSLSGLVYLSAALLVLNLTGTHTECPVDISPQTAVVSYGSSVSVDCSTNITHNGIGWEASDGVVPMKTDKSLVTWRVSNLREWDIEPFCYINYDNKQCEEYLPVTVYKTPDIVSISTVNHTRPVTEGFMLILQCDIINVAPVRNLTVRWYKGETQMNYTTFNDTIKTPVNITDTLQITPDRDDDGSQYRCVAVLQLGEEGPQPPPTVTSKAFHIRVFYKPKHKVINETIYINDREVTLNCTVMANPAPAYSWHSEHLKEKTTSSVLSSSKLSPGIYTCTATNFLGNSQKKFIIRSSGGRSTFWAILLSGLGLIVILITSYVIYKHKSNQNSVI